MVFSYDWLKNYVKKMPKPEKLAELLTVHFAEVEEVKKKEGDVVLDIDIRPNRASDCFSHLGVAREISAILKSSLIMPSTKITSVLKKKAKDFIEVKVLDKKACPRYTARVMTDVKVGPSPKWLKDKLSVCGLNSINNVVDVANYVMLETGQPLHAFDGDKLAGKKIIVRFAKNKERITTLDDQKFELNSDVLVIADNEKPIAVAGIKGGQSPEISSQTKVVVLESANFAPTIIRRGSKRLNLRTDASIRFEHGLSPDLTEFAVNRAIHLIQKIASGKVAQGMVDVYPNKVISKTIKLEFERVSSLLGIKVPLSETKNILKRLGFQVTSSSAKFLKVKVPTFRQDVSIQEDLIEEIGRLYGYDKIPFVFPIASLIPAEKNEFIFWEDRVKTILKEAGFSETYNYSFIGEGEAKIFSYSSGELVELQNPLSQEQNYLRPSLIPNLLKDVQKNQKNFSKIIIFELGKIFSRKGEKRQLTGLVTGDEFYYLKGMVDLLLQKMGISDIWYDDYQATPEQSKLSLWHPKKSAEIKIGQQEVGFLGEVSQKITQALKIQNKVIVFDIDFDALQKLASEEQEYMPLSKFPTAVRDLAVLVPKRTKVVNVLNQINAVGGPIIRDIDLFDIYEGEELPEGQKNLAFHIIYQSEERTLTSKEVDEIHQKIIKALEENPEWQVRK
ncbi:MAG: phenylalanine--tRNA ligase subunit beta [Candidatus Nealsonbacteria bacterium]